MSFSIRPAIRVDTPLIIGIAGPTKSGKTYSAHRLARGIAKGGPIVMLNAEGARGHQYADIFDYQACDIEAPFSYGRYLEALAEIAKSQPACVIIDSVSHAHDGPGGMLEQHDRELDRMAGTDWGKRQKMTFTAWIEPKKQENEFIYALLGTNCPVILCFRAKEKLKIEKGKEPVNLGYRAIASDRISFETIFTLMLPERSKGMPDRELSEMREPFDSLVPMDAPVDEELGKRLAEWASGKQADPEETLVKMREASLNGKAALKKAWEALSDKMRDTLREHLQSLKDAAAKADGTANGKHEQEQAAA